MSRAEANIVTGGIAPSMMPAGERRKLMSWPRPDGDPAAAAAWDHVNRARQRLAVEACYCSLFDECWTTQARADVPRPVATCEIGNRITYDG